MIPSGETGIAHMFEHMAFKGTETIGTKNYPLERKAMDEVEHIYDQYDAERNKGLKADPKTLADLQQQLKAAMEKADSYVIPNAYPELIEENGGVGLNAGTGEDSTNYFYNFPRNRLELWFLLESQRFYDPVFREFYKERDVVREERRMRVESSPQGQLVEALLATAFEAHPYRNMPGGWASDIENFRLTEADRVLQEILRSGEHHHRDCRRRGSQGMPAAGGQSIFRSCLPDRCPAARARLSPAERREAGGGGIAGAALYGDRVQAARSE